MMLETEEHVEQTVETKPEFDKERQRADQFEANYRKERQVREQLAAQMDAQREESEQLRRQLEELNAKAGAKQSVSDLLPEINTGDASVEELAEYLKQTRKIIIAQQEKLASLDNVASTYKRADEQSRAEQAESARRQKILNDLCDDLETEYGKGLRNAAIERFQKDVAENGAPANPAIAARRLEKCFKQVKTEKGKSSSAPQRFATDPGSGGGRPTYGGQTLKKGSLSEVLEQIKSAKG